ncbi:MAG: GNAT family N-acetyltransferase [bacterium]|nr:MAG: GNAT family N-acetyltransferase [bacterium]
MTIEEFELLPWKLGWKYEYWNGQAHISPRHHFVTTSINIEPRAVRSPCKLRSIVKEDEPQLISAYIAAFSDTIEYCDWKPEQIVESVRQNIQGFLTGKRGKPLDCSRVALFDHSQFDQQSIAGAALFAETKSGQKLLDMLFVIPQWQRRGLATALVSSAIDILHNKGIKTLVSRYYLGNEASQAWHEKFGFEELPDLSLARLYHHHLQNELWRQERIGDLNKSECEKLISEVKRWKVQVNKLERIAEQEGMEAAFPSLRH